MLKEIKYSMFKLQCGAEPSYVITSIISTLSKDICKRNYQSKGSTANFAIRPYEVTMYLLLRHLTCSPSLLFPCPELSEEEEVRRVSHTYFFSKISYHLIIDWYLQWRKQQKNHWSASLKIAGNTSGHMQINQT